MSRKYTLILPAEDKDIYWSLFENQLFKIAEDIEKACGVPITIKMTNFNTSAREIIIRWGHIFKG